MISKETNENWKGSWSRLHTCGVLEISSGEGSGLFDQDCLPQSWRVRMPEE